MFVIGWIGLNQRYSMPENKVKICYIDIEQHKSSLSGQSYLILSLTVIISRWKLPVMVGSSRDITSTNIRHGVYHVELHVAVQHHDGHHQHAVQQGQDQSYLTNLHSNENL